MLRLGLLVTVPVVLLDQITKWLVLADLMDPPRTVVVTGFFNADSAWGPAILSGVALVISVCLLIWLYRAESRILAVAIGMVLGGAIGNLIDRARFGAVVDFLDFHALGHHWPAFNVADSAITVGVALLLYDSLFEKRKAPE